MQALFVDNFHLPSQSRLAKLARELGLALIADFERADAAGLDNLIAFVYHLIVSKSFAHQLTGAADPHDAAAALWNSTRAAVVVTGGD